MIHSVYALMQKKKSLSLKATEKKLLLTLCGTGGGKDLLKDLSGIK